MGRFSGTDILQSKVHKASGTAISIYTVLHLGFSIIYIKYTNVLKHFKCVYYELYT